MLTPSKESVEDGFKTQPASNDCGKTHTRLLTRHPSPFTLETSDLAAQTTAIPVQSRSQNRVNEYASTPASKDLPWGDKLSFLEMQVSLLHYSDTIHPTPLPRSLVDPIVRSLV